MNNTSGLQRFVAKKSKEAFKLKMHLPLGSQNNMLDFFNLTKAKFSPVCLNKQEREQKMTEIKSKMDLSILTHFNKQCIYNQQRVKDDREGFVFNKINPISHISPTSRPNNYNWSQTQFNKRIVGQMIAENEENEKSKLYS